MTYKEKYGNYTNFQNEHARKALEYDKGELQILEAAARFQNDYAVRTGLAHSEIIERRDSLKKTIEYLEKLLASKGEIEDITYRAYWLAVKDKEV